MLPYEPGVNTQFISFYGGESVAPRVGPRRIACVTDSDAGADTDTGTDADTGAGAGTDAGADTEELRYGQPPVHTRCSAWHAVVQSLSFIAQWVLHSAHLSLQSGVQADVG